MTSYPVAAIRMIGQYPRSYIDTTIVSDQLSFESVRIFGRKTILYDNMTNGLAVRPDLSYDPALNGLRPFARFSRMIRHSSRGALTNVEWLTIRSSESIYKAISSH